jgi:hypothetical protein
MIAIDGGIERLAGINPLARSTLMNSVIGQLYPGTRWAVLFRRASTPFSVTATDSLLLKEEPNPHTAERARSGLGAPKPSAVQTAPVGTCRACAAIRIAPCRPP